MSIAHFPSDPITQDGITSLLSNQLLAKGDVIRAGTLPRLFIVVHSELRKGLAHRKHSKLPYLLNK